jgi:hypothetical protein
MGISMGRSMAGTVGGMAAAARAVVMRAVVMRVAVVRAVAEMVVVELMDGAGIAARLETGMFVDPDRAARRRKGAAETEGQATEALETKAPATEAVVAGIEGVAGNC